MASKNGSRPIEVIKSRYQQSRQSVEVREWSDTGEPLVVFFSPISSADVDKARSLARNRDDNASDALENCYLLVTKAEDEAGEKLFGLGDAMALYRQGGYLTVQRVVNQMYLTSLKAKEARQAIDEDPT
jgi:hypothetical protein